MGKCKLHHYCLFTPAYFSLVVPESSLSALPSAFHTVLTGCLAGLQAPVAYMYRKWDLLDQEVCEILREEFWILLG